MKTNNTHRLLMKRRREHQECDSKPGGRGCLVLGRDVCLDKKRSNHLKVVWRHLRSGIPLWLVVVAVALLAIVIAPTRISSITGERLNLQRGDGYEGVH